MAMKLLEYIVLIALFGAFLAMAWNALQKYLSNDTSFSEVEELREKLAYPGITICPGAAEVVPFLSNLTQKYLVFSIHAVFDGKVQRDAEEFLEQLSHPVIVSTGLLPCIRYMPKGLRPPSLHDGVSP